MEHRFRQLGFRRLGGNQRDVVLERQQQFRHRGHSLRLHDTKTSRFGRGCLRADSAFERLDKFRGRRKPVDRLLGKRAGKHRLQCREMCPRERRHRVDRLQSGSNDSPAPQHLVDDRGQAEDVGPMIPGRSLHALGRRVWPANRHGRADPFERSRNPEADDASAFRREQDVARMERAVFDQSLRGGIERLSQLARHGQRLVKRQRASFANHDIERVAGEVILREVCDDAVETSGDGRRDDRMPKSGVDQPFEFADQLMDTFGRQVEAEDFDRNQAIAIRFVRTKHRTQSTGTDLMKYAKWTKGVWRGGAGSFRVQ